MTNDHIFARARLRYQPSEAFDINLSFDYREQDNDLLFLEPDDSYELAVGNPAAVGIRIVDQDAQLIDNNNGWGVSLAADYTFANDFVLTSITGYRTAERMVGSDEDATRVFTLDARFFEDDFEHLTQELRLTSPDDRRLRYVLGFFYFDQNAKTDRVVALGPGFGGPPAGVDAAIQDSKVDTSNFAVFVNANFDLTERLTVSGGARYTDEDKDTDIEQVVFPGFGLATLLQEQSGRKEDYFTATANIQYQFNDDILAYFTYSHGYKSGGFNVDLVPAAGDLFYDEETVDSFETGLKTDLFNNRLRFNITAYHAEYDDYQVFQFRFDPFSGTTALLVSNAASVTTEGVEVEGIARISDNMEIEYGLGYADATFDDFPGGAVDSITGAPLNVAGNTLARSPEVTSSVTGRYRFETGSLTSNLVLNYTYRSKQFFNPDNRANTVQQGYGLLNASLDVKLNEQWGLAVFGRNLADKNYRGNRGVSFLGVPFSLYAQPRTYGVELYYRF
jgi:iron complex outermembrane receptor protein